MHERENSEQDAGPNDQERSQPHVPSRASSARSSSSVSFPFGYTSIMRFGLIDLLFAIACITIGMALGHFVAPELPVFLRRLVGPVAGVGIYLLLVYPLYKALRLFPMILPRCPCCAKFQHGFHVLSGQYPRITFKCPSCNGEFVIWHDGKPGDQETWERPVLALRWPYELGRFCRIQKPEQIAALEAPPPVSISGSSNHRTLDSLPESGSGGGR